MWTVRKENPFHEKTTVYLIVYVWSHLIKVCYVFYKTKQKKNICIQNVFYFLIIFTERPVDIYVWTRRFTTTFTKSTIYFLIVIIEKLP